jgi:hypothetical protein
MSVVMPLITPRSRLVHSEINSVSIFLGELDSKLSRQLRAAGRIDLWRKNDEHFPTESGITPVTGFLSRVPQLRSISCPFEIRTLGYSVRQDDLAVDDVFAIGIVVGLARERDRADPGGSERGISWSSGARFPRAVERVGTEGGNQEVWRGTPAVSRSQREDCAASVSLEALTSCSKKRTPAILAGSLPHASIGGGG